LEDGQSNDAFLQYSYWQIQQFSFEVSSQMISSLDFFTIPDFTNRARRPTHLRTWLPETSLHVPSNIGPDTQAAHYAMTISLQTSPLSGAAIIQSDILASCSWCSQSRPGDSKTNI
jgi:hypothetical protein